MPEGGPHDVSKSMSVWEDELLTLSRHACFCGVHATIFTCGPLPVKLKEPSRVKGNGSDHLRSCCFSAGLHALVPSYASSGMVPFGKPHPRLVVPSPGCYS